MFASHRAEVGRSAAGLSCHTRATRWRVMLLCALFGLDVGAPVAAETVPPVCMQVGQRPGRDMKQLRQRQQLVVATRVLRRARRSRAGPKLTVLRLLARVSAKAPIRGVCSGP